MGLWILPSATLEQLYKNKTSQTADTLTCQAICKFAYTSSLNGHVQTWKLEVQCADDMCPWFWYQRAVDCTPVKVFFSKLHDLARTMARYWMRDEPQKSSELGPWRLVGLDEFLLRSRKKRKLVNSGVLEMMAQQGSLTWPEVHSSHSKDFIAVRREDLKTGPTFLSSNNADTIFKALESTAPGLSWPEIQSVSARCSFSVLSIART